MSFTLFILGAGGIAGAIETGKGFIPALVVLVIGLVGMYYEAKKYQEGEQYKRRINYNHSNCHSYPSCLGADRRA